MRILIVISFLAMMSCTNDVKDVDALFVGADLNKEHAEVVEILYSDSSMVRIKIEAPKMTRHLEKSNMYDEFPEGLKVTFYNDNGKPSSWLEAGYAIKRENEGKVYVKEDVVVYNSRNDKLRTIELIWDENEKTISTEKAVKIMQPSIGDTLFGYGVIANEDFTRFEIKRNVSAIKNYDELYPSDGK